MNYLVPFSDPPSITMNIGIKNFLEVRAGTTVNVDAVVEGKPSPEVRNKNSYDLDSLIIMGVFFFGNYSVIYRESFILNDNWLLLILMRGIGNMWNFEWVGTLPIVVGSFVTFFKLIKRDRLLNKFAENS